MKKNAYLKRVEKTNKEFQEASPERKRVMIAQDVITAIEAKKFFADTGNIVKIINCPRDISLQEYILQPENACRVCAKGGLLMGFVARTNELLTNDLSFVTGTNPNGIYSKEHVKLMELFTLEQLALIEAAFEGKQYLHENIKGESIDLGLSYDSLKEYKNAYINDDERLIVICENIIANNGTFVW